MASPQSLYSADIIKDYPTIAADIDLLAASQTLNSAGGGLGSAYPCRRIHVGTGGGGTLKLVTSGGSTGTFYNIADGSVFDVQATKVLASGTTVTNITVLW